jgi:predicted anti-sigma-YlaC factor YlaD
VRPARCDRSRESISLRLDGVLSTFETALLDRHLRRCASCSAFAAAAEEQTQLLRAAALEEPSRRVVVPGRRRPAVRRGLTGALTAGAAAALAAVAVLTPGGTSTRAAAPHVTAARGVSANLTVVAAHPSPSSAVDVPRLEVEPASLADGPVHGVYHVPV